MAWQMFLLQFLAGALAANSVPHLVHGLSGKPFRTPFVRFSGTKVSGPVLNVIWGWANAFAAHWLHQMAGPVSSALPFALGALLAGVGLAALFARDHQ